MKKILAFIFLLSMTANLYAQTKETNDYHNVLGATASTYCGQGLMYQYIFNKDYRLKFAGYYYHSTSNNNYDKSDLYTIGVEFQKTFHQTESTRFYGLAGINYYHSNDDYTSIYYPSTSSTGRVMGGVGFGIEFTAWSHLLINFTIL